MAGAKANTPRTRIVCTIGPASREPSVLRELVQGGMGVARLNFSHGDHTSHAENIRRIRAVSREVGKPVAILADLQGPKLRVAEMVPDGVPLQEGQGATLTTEDVVGRDPSAIPVQNERLPQFVKPGDRILLDDGLIELAVLSVSEREIHCRVVVGGMLKSNKGMNLPRSALDLPSITPKDRGDLSFALENGADWIALSFVRSADDLMALRALIEEHLPNGGGPPLMAKIEKPEALDNIQAIIDAADAIMVARGDLGIEVPPERVPMAQKRIIRACNQAGVPVVTATQMLESMIRNPRPTRAEASDVANAILDGTDAIMLSGETSIGDYPAQAVRTMARIAIEIESASAKAVSHSSAPLPERGISIADAVSRAAVETATDLGAQAIITPTASGYTARMISRHRPSSPIIAITPDPLVQRRLMLYWGIAPLLANRADNTDRMIAQTIEAAEERGLVRQGDTVVVTAGAAGCAPGTTNLIRVLVVGDDIGSGAQISSEEERCKQTP